VILFLDEERAYLNWIAHHRRGFVLDCLRKPTKAHLALHRATCLEVKHNGSKRTHWTTGRHMKGCSLQLDELKTWATEQTGSEPTCCAQCAPDREPSAQEAEAHLTRLDRELLSYVLDIATCHLDDEDRAYRLTVGMVARCFGKTEGQLTASLSRLVDDGLLLILGKTKPGQVLSPRCGVFPTAQALRTLEFYAGFGDEQIEAELSKLGPD
jgi:hypothetical protein